MLPDVLPGTDIGVDVSVTLAKQKYDIDLTVHTEELTISPQNGNNLCSCCTSGNNAVVYP